MIGTVKIETASPVPLYLQIVEQLRRSIASGHSIKAKTAERAYLDWELRWCDAASRFDKD